MSNDQSCAPWSDLDHDLLNIVMMRLGVVDFLPFSGVCKSWRSLALSNRETFMASCPPVSVSIVSTDADEKECYLEDFKGRKYKTMLPDFTGGECIGLTSGYLVFFMRETSEFRLVNPITRRQLHFSDFPDDLIDPNRVILFFSASISKWVFLVLYQYSKQMWFCIAGERTWNHVSHNSSIRDLHAVKGEIYALTYSFHVSELRLGGSKLTPLEIKQPDCAFLINFVSSGERLYGIGFDQDYYQDSFHELDIRKMKWVKACEKTLGEYAFFICEVNRHFVAVKRESWADPQSRVHGRYAGNGGIRFITANMWYFPNECLTVNFTDE